MLRQKSKPGAEARKTGDLEALLPPHRSKLITSTGRSALSVLLEHLSVSPERPVFLPAYLPEGILHPFQRHGVKLVFYRLTSDLKPDLDHLNSLIARNGAEGIFVLIHYFGFDCNSPALAALLKTTDMLVLGDYAHGLFGNKGRRFSDREDLALFSLNKFLPISDGAILTSHRDDIDLGELRSSLEGEMPTKAREAYELHLALNHELFLCTSSDAAKNLLKDTGNAYENYYRIIDNANSAWPPTAKSLEELAGIDFKQMAAQREINKNIVYTRLENSLVELVFPEPETGYAPFCVPIRIKRGNREHILDLLMERDVLLSCLIDKWDTALSQDKTFAVERDWLAGHALVPINEFISAHEMLQIMESLNALEV